MKMFSPMRLAVCSERGAGKKIDALIKTAVEWYKSELMSSRDDARYLYVNAQAGFSGNRSAVDVRDPDVAKKFPLFQLAARSTVTIGPGDALFVPDGWWHTARCVSEAPSVTLGGNYVDEIHEVATYPREDSAVRALSGFKDPYAGGNYENGGPLQN